MPAYYLEIAVIVLGLVLLMVEAFTGPGCKRCIGLAAAAGLGVVWLLTFLVKPHDGCDCAMWQFYTDDPLALYYKGFALLTTIVVLLLSLEYLPVLEKFSARAGGGPAVGEFFCLPVFVCAGIMWMASAIDLTTIFLSLELVTIAFYILTGYMRKNVGSLEAGVKYLILGALSTGFLVFGFAWLFGVTGQTNLALIGEALRSGNVDTTPALFAFALILVAISFKVAAVPFHFWVPDVYQGAPTPVTAYLSVGSKAAGLVVAGRLLEPFLTSPATQNVAIALLAAIASATLLLGNLAAIPQSNFKRLLAYSSISHAGFLVLALAGGGELEPHKIVAFYMAAYLCMTLLAFAVLIVVNRATGSDDLKAFDGLHKRSPFLAFAMLVAAASLAGVPLTAGFLGKLFVFMAAASAEQWVPLAVAVAGASAGFYYYFKVVRSMYWNAPAADDAAALAISPMLKVLLILLAAGSILLGLYPQAVLELLG